MQVLHCYGCGAEYVLGPQTLSLTCAFCGSNLVVKATETKQLIPPNAVIPFALDEQAAARRFADWLRSSKIRPERTPENPRGLYFPVWTFDIFGEAPWKAIVARDRDQYETIEGTGVVAYNDLPVPAAHSLPPLLETALQTFDFSNPAPYDPRFLASFPAELYDIAMADASLDARAEAARRAPRDIREQIGTDSFASIQNLSVSSARLSINSFRLALIPLWLAEYHADEKNYPILINGQSGELFSGKGGAGLLGWLDPLIT
jgi:hypothetical protein